jgi:hypothetical protein
MRWSHTPARIVSKSLSTGRKPKVRSYGIRLCPVFTASWSTLLKRRYPDIAVEVYRGGSTDLGPRLLNEAQAGRYVADALESTPGLLMLLRERRLLKPYTSPELGRYPDEARPKPTARASTGSPIEKPTLDSATTLDKLRRRKFRKAFKIS